LRPDLGDSYDNANIDNWTKYGVANVNPDPWTRRRHQSGSMLQSGNGETHRNFELLLGDSASAGFSHVSRDGSSLKWTKVSDIAASNLVGQPAIVGTSFNRDFHAVGTDKDQTLRQWAYSQSGKTWSQISTITGKKIDGFPGLAQSDGSQLVMVVKQADGTLNEVCCSPCCFFEAKTDNSSGNNPPTARPGPKPAPPLQATSPRAAPRSSKATSDSTSTTNKAAPAATSTPSPCAPTANCSSSGAAAKTRPSGQQVRSSALVSHLTRRPS